MTDEVRKVAPITQGRMKEAEFERNVWTANVEYGVTLQDIQEPGFWALMGMYLKPYDQIEARSEDGSWIAYLIVTGCDRTWARVAVDRVVKLTTSDVAMTQEAKHTVEWKGPQHKYAVIRLSDREMVKTGFTNKDDAGLWMREHERVVA